MGAKQRIKHVPPGLVFLSREHRFAYLQIPKAACTSVQAALLPLFRDVESHESAHRRGWVHQALRHTEHMLRKRAFLAGRAGDPADYFVFSFVRNPWDRLLSCYHSKIAKPRISLPELRYEGGILYPNMPFREFVLVVSRTSDEEANHHFRAQSPILSGPSGELVPDFIGRFENLSRDFSEACKRGGVELDLPHINPSSWPLRGYRDAYDSESAKLVGERYAEDVERFGYSF